MDHILKSNLGYMDLKEIRTSPDYQQNTRKKIYPMIRQLGTPSFFVSFSSVGICWKPLVDAIKQIRKKTKKTIKNDIENNDIDSFIRDDLVTCAWYYRNSIFSL